MKHNWFMLLSLLITVMVETPILLLFLFMGIDNGYSFLALFAVGYLWYAVTAILIGWWCGAVSRAVCGVTNNRHEKASLKVGDFIESDSGTVYRVNGVFGDYITYEAVSGVGEVANHPNRSDPPTLYYRGVPTGK